MEQESWSGLPFPTPGYLPEPGIEHASLASPALAGRFLITAPPGKPIYSRKVLNIENIKNRVVKLAFGPTYYLSSFSSETLEYITILSIELYRL